MRGADRLTVAVRNGTITTLFPASALDRNDDGRIDGLDTGVRVVSVARDGRRIDSLRIDLELVTGTEAEGISELTLLGVTELAAADIVV